MGKFKPHNSTYIGSTQTCTPGDGSHDKVIRW